ncbi:rod shape-determining protein RodA [Meridianimarinicoccus roseus]|uniref:Rod shape-determining protein RodA n=1 Tax=Meridianimarinicoccus roseus TaxID=2072018 RepID=A0A2V2LR08_9RHOB|nr:DUF4399 domain-containing protein [Meridianimarinicoccus roseus]PWR03913.1 rod shape-determining protein RodA [Meridianimarinicoccus roseus]
MKLTSLAALLAAGLFAAPLLAQQTPAPDGAEVYFISPADGATVSNPVTIRFGLSGMGIAPAGYDVDNTGHHHLLINLEPGDVDMTTSLPATDQIVHFGGGQTEMTRELPAGTHTLRLLLGDYSHVPHDPPVMSDPITITVE